jgi:hypothetical protein
METSAAREQHKRKGEVAAERQGRQPKEFVKIARSSLIRTSATDRNEVRDDEVG